MSQETKVLRLILLVLIGAALTTGTVLLAAHVRIEKDRNAACAQQIADGPSQLTGDYPACDR